MNKTDQCEKGLPLVRGAWWGFWDNLSSVFGGGYVSETDQFVKIHRAVHWWFRHVSLAIYTLVKFQTYSTDQL